MEPASDGPSTPTVVDATTVWHKLVAVVQRISRAGEAELDGPVNAAQFLILSHISRSGPAAQSGLVAELGTTPANISQLVTKLEAADLVRREAEGTTRRVHLTDDGRAVIAHLMPQYRAFITARFAVLGEEDLTQLLRLLAILDTEGR
ncbi:MarR family winged helix-turn-helix transcriptional regulator [Euzebya tangerina]|uniref:MarR family winged helix-turn-helix transcriptional regulator n=1 Tax=Euzebya tangerina TaxID=591198 RepID=UPI0013C2C0B0|nr:MarR family transcriptional regulator [Euzebya tangerina]